MTFKKGDLVYINDVDGWAFPGHKVHSRIATVMTSNSYGISVSLKWQPGDKFRGNSIILPYTYDSIKYLIRFDASKKLTKLVL